MDSTVPVLLDVQQAPPEWLTTILRREGVLGQGRVERVQTRLNEAFNSQIAHLEVQSSGAAGPSALLLKLNHDHQGELEHLFYHATRTARAAALPIVHCYETAYSAETGASHCLLADVSQTHAPPVTRQQLLTHFGVPRQRHLAQIVDTLAQFHVYWWQHPQLGTSDALFAIRPWYCDHAFFQRHVQRRQTEWDHFTDSVGDTVSPELRALYRTVLDKLPALWERYLAPRLLPPQHITLTHGDCYLTQILCPKVTEAGSTYLVDFDSVSANFGAFDLAFLVSTFWTRTQRWAQNREEQVLRQYHQALCQYGVTGYAWDTLLTDYKLMVTLMIFDPVWDQTSGASRAYWWPKLQCLTDAYIDLNCAALLTPG